MPNFLPITYLVSSARLDLLYTTTYANRFWLIVRQWTSTVILVLFAIVATIYLQENVWSMMSTVSAIRNIKIILQNIASSARADSFIPLIKIYVWKRKSDVFIWEATVWLVVNPFCSTNNKAIAIFRDAKSILIVAASHVQLLSLLLTRPASLVIAVLIIGRHVLNVTLVICWLTLDFALLSIRTAYLTQVRNA